MLLAVPEIVFEMIPLGLESVVVLVLNLPASSAGSGQRDDVVLGNRKIGGPGVRIGLLAFMIGDGELTPIDFQGVLAFDQRHLVGKAVGVSMEVRADSDALLERSQIRAWLEKLQPPVEGLVRVGLAGKEKVKAVEQRLAAERLVSIQVIAQEGERAAEIPGSGVREPAFGGRQLAILLGVTVLGSDELRPQREDFRFARGHSDRDPAGGPVTGALETIPLDKGFGQVDGMSVLVLPIAVPTEGAEASDTISPVDA